LERAVPSHGGKSNESLIAVGVAGKLLAGVKKKREAKV